MILGFKPGRENRDLRIGFYILRLAKEKDSSVGRRETEAAKLKSILWAYKIMKESNPERRRDLLNTHGLSIPELADLARHYALRLRNSKANGMELEKASMDFALASQRAEAESVKSYRHHIAVGRK